MDYNLFLTRQLNRQNGISITKADVSGFRPKAEQNAP